MPVFQSSCNMWVVLLGFLGSSYGKMIACAVHQLRYRDFQLLYCMLKNIRLMLYLSHQVDLLLIFYESYMNNLSTIYCSANLIQDKNIFSGKFSIIFDGWFELVLKYNELLLDLF